MKHLARSALAEMGTLLLKPRSGALVDTALDDLLSQVAEAVGRRARLPVTLRVDPLGPLPREVRVAVYRITQEALNNIVEHAAASRAEVRLRCVLSPPYTKSSDERGDGLELCIADNGCGFIPESTSVRHLGLRIMREHAEAIGAELRIESQLGHGTRVMVAWPRARWQHRP
jgi:signal transduction histidine kinase